MRGDLMLQFILVEFTSGIYEKAYQVAFDGVTIGYYTLDGKLLDTSMPTESHVIDSFPIIPDWKNTVILPPVTPVYVEPPTWTTAEFFDRFTPQEYGMICTAALQSPLVFGMVAKLNAHPTIHAANPELNMGLDGLVKMGILTAARKTEIVGGYVPSKE